MNGHAQTQLLEQKTGCQLLDARFSVLKQSIIAPENKQKVINSYERLCNVLKQETAFIAKNGPSMIPEIDFDLVIENGGVLPDGLMDVVRDRGCVILRNVVPQAQAEEWEAELKKYTTDHASVGGFPKSLPQTWSLWWTRPQVQIRSHPRVLEALTTVSKLWHLSDPAEPFDLDSQVVYPDRFRIRYPSKEKEFTLNAHLDSGAIERWEDPLYRKCYQKVFDGQWEDYDPWCADHRSDAKMDLYEIGNSCSCFRTMQGWLGLSHTGTGEGTLRLLPSLKASVAYNMLRPFFVIDEKFDDVTPVFPGAVPSNTQFKPTKDLHPHLDLDHSIVGIPPVKPGDFVFWHCDLVHEVDKFNPGKNDSSVVYTACTPLTPYNLQSLLNVREAFLAVCPPKDFESMRLSEIEAQHKDHGAKKENILTDQGMRAMGFMKFEEGEAGITEGQHRMRVMANQALGLA